MIPETPTTVCASTASLMPGTARIGPILTTGLDGGKSTKSASAIASATPGAGDASAAPTGTIAFAGAGAGGGSQHPWKWITESSRTTWVSIVSSDIGSRRT